jgi:5-methylthioribose kinase
MSRFSIYFLMNADDVIDYVKEKLTIFKEDAELTCKEIGTETKTMFSENN